MKKFNKKLVFVRQTLARLEADEMKPINAGRAPATDETEAHNCTWGDNMSYWVIDGMCIGQSMDWRFAC